MKDGEIGGCFFSVRHAEISRGTEGKIENDDYSSTFRRPSSEMCPEKLCSNDRAKTKVGVWDFVVFLFLRFCV